MTGKRASIVAAVTGLLAIGGVSAVSAAAADAAAAVPAPRWHIVKQVNGQAAGLFTAVVATGKSTGWAFEFPFDGPTVAFERNGATWTKEAFPSLPQELVVAAAASSPSNVWVAANQIGSSATRVLRFDGHKWSVVKRFTRSVNQLSVSASNDVWAFGGADVLHFDGHSWAQVGGPVVGGSVINDHDVWAFNHSNVYHWRGPGHLWTVTSLTALLPPKQQNGLNFPELVDVLALSDRNIYAIGNGNRQDEGGPIVVLHFNGHKWSRVAEGGAGFGGGAVSADGHGGLWIPMPAGPTGAASFMLHYTGGKLLRIALPSNARAIAIAPVPGTMQQLAGGSLTNGNAGVSVAAVVLQFS